jgi:hypothetical protein
LYLGRNFELKRKDYLHEEARQQSEGASLDNIIVSVKNAIEEIENIDHRRAELDSPLHRDLTEVAEEIGLDDFEKLIPEIRAAVVKYAQSSNNQELLKSANQLVADENKARSVLNTLLLLLEAEKN